MHKRAQRKWDFEVTILLFKVAEWLKLMQKKVKLEDYVKTVELMLNVV